MAKNNFQAKEAVTDPNYAQNVGSIGQQAAQAGVGQQGQGFQNLSDTYGQQKSFATMLQEAAAGRGGPTMADQQIKDATARNNANAAGFAAGAKGLNPALAARQALMAQAGNNQQAAGQAAQTRVQEQLAAREQLGGALAGEAATAGGMTSAGQGLLGTGGSLANTSNANLINSRNSANDINEKVASQNAGILNGAIGGVLGGASKAFTMGLAEGGVVPGEPEGTQSDETSIALAKGGTVPSAPALHTGLPKAAGAMPHRSFAAQVAHHLSREYFAEGGMAETEHSSYDFPAMDLRSAKSRKPKMGEGIDVSPTKPIQENEQGEGYDSEGKEKKLRLAEGGEAPAEEPYETQMEYNLRHRDEQREKNKEKDTETAMGDLQKVSESKLAYGGYAQPEDHSEEDYNPADDEPEADNEPDTDVGIDPQEAEEKGIPRYAEGGEAGDESAGLDTSKSPDQILHPSVQEHPSMFARIGAGLEGASQGFAGGTGSAVPSMVSAGPSVSQRQAAGPAGPAGPPRIPTRIPVREPGGAIAPLLTRPPAPPQVAGGNIYAGGGQVPGHANVQGDSLKNDVVDAKLSPGEVVLPRSISHDPEKAKKFVQRLMEHGETGHEALSAIKKRKS